MANDMESTRQPTAEAADSWQSSEPSADIDPATAQILSVLDELKSDIEDLRTSQDREQEMDARHTPRPGPSLSPGPIELTLATAALSALLATLGTGVSGLLLRALSFVAFLLSCLAASSFFFSYMQVEFPEAAKASSRTADVLGTIGLLRLWTLLLKRKRDIVTTPAEDALLGFLSLALSFVLLAAVLLLWFVASFAAALSSLL
jgi:hypothetical protein